jgi:hypothetical protein
MRIALTKERVADRLTEFTPAHYQNVFGIVKGVALGFSAFVLLPVTTGTDHPWQRFALWIPSVMAVLVSYLTSSRGILLTSHRYNAWDAIVPLLMGLTECILFVLLAPAAVNLNGQQDLWLLWSFAFAFHMGLAVLMVSNRIRLFRDQDFEPCLLPLVKDCLGWISSDRAGALFFTFLFVLAGFLLRSAWFSELVDVASVQVGLAVTATAVLAGVLFRTDRQRALMVSFLEGLEETDLVPEQRKCNSTPSSLEGA